METSPYIDPHKVAKRNAYRLLRTRLGINFVQSKRNLSDIERSFLYHVPADRHGARLIINKMRVLTEEIQPRREFIWNKQDNALRQKLNLYGQLAVNLLFPHEQAHQRGGINELVMRLYAYINLGDEEKMVCVDYLTRLWSLPGECTRKLRKLIYIAETDAVHELGYSSVLRQEI